MMWARALSFVVVAAVGVPSAFADDEVVAAPGVVERTELEVAPAGRRITRLEVDNPLGDVRIEGHDGPGLKIIAVKHAPDDEILDRLRVSLIPDAAGPIRIMTAVDGGREAKTVAKRLIRIDLIIQAPRDAFVDGRTGDGRLELINMDAGGELDATSGPITVRNVAGQLSAHTIDAALSISEVFGIVEAGALDGDVTLDTIRGARLAATVGGGRISGRRVRSRELELTSISGDIQIEGEAVLGGSVRIASVRGRVDVRLRGAVIVRAQGSAVTLAGASDVREEAGGWRVASYGTARTAASIELTSRHGTVAFASVAPGSPSK